MNTMTESPVPTADDLRALIARRRLWLYRVAAAARLHPMLLGRILNGRRALTPDYAERILRAIEMESAAPDYGKAGRR